jgi:hypothetical protein
MSGQTDKPAQAIEWETETYSANDATELAQVLLDTGLLFAVNAAVLHHHGLALGVTAERGRVTGLSVHRTSDPDGIWFDEASVVQARQKMRAAGILLHRDPDQ